MTELETNKRKLVTIRTIDALEPIEGADAIEVAHVEGWKVVVKKGDFKAGDFCIYAEIDCFLPDGNPAWQFLVDKQPKMFEGARGHRLRTVKLRGQISQGLVLPLTASPQLLFTIDDPRTPTVVEWESPDQHVEALRIRCVLFPSGTPLREIDFSTLLGVKKYEAPLPACLVGQAAGLFPSFLRKSDQERAQNLKAEIFGYDSVIIPAEGERPEIVRPPKADRDARYEITTKLDGSSMTAYVRAEISATGEVGIIPKVGVCSRNLELKLSEANKDNTFIRMFYDSELDFALEQFFTETGRSIAIQGELVGEGIQGNRENIKGHKFFVFDIFDIDAQRYLTPPERMKVYAALTQNDGAKINHVPVLYTDTTLQKLDLNSIDDLLEYAEGPSLNNSIREGVVFKRLDGEFSFKVISNKFLSKEKD